MYWMINFIITKNLLNIIFFSGSRNTSRIKIKILFYRVAEFTNCLEPIKYSF